MVDGATSWAASSAQFRTERPKEECAMVNVPAMFLKLQVSEGDPRFISDPPSSDHGESASYPGEQETSRLPRDDTPNSLGFEPVLDTGTSDRIAGRDVPIVGVGVLGSERKEEGTVTECSLNEQNVKMTEQIINIIRAGSTRPDWERNCLLKSLYKQVKAFNGNDSSSFHHNSLGPT